jgi:hypothetical protein
VAFTYPTVSDFQEFFARDFPYGTDPENFVLNSDISKAQSMAQSGFPQNLFGDQSSFNVAFNLLSAHWLVTNLRTAGQGLNGQYNFLQNSKAVGSVNEAFAIPQRILDNPSWSMLTKTNYGAQFLQLLLPQLTGAIYIAHGTTIP